MSQNQIFAAFDTFAKSEDNARQKLVQSLQRLGITTLEDVRPYALAWASARTGCQLVAGKRKASGSLVLDNAHPKYEAAKKATQRLMAAFTPKDTGAGKARTQVDPVARLLKQFAGLSKTQQRQFLAQI